MEKSGLKNIIKEMTFDKFQATEAWQESIKASAMAYADSLDGWLLFCGQVGSGKTHLCTAVCRHRLLKGDEVRYMPWRDDIAKLKALSMDNEERSRFLSDLKTAQILYIDDLFKTGKAADGTDNPTGADVNIAFEIINYRYNNNLPTIVSTEKTTDELIAIDEATATRITEKAKKAYTLTINRDIRRNYRLRDALEV
jgi:DNA replication protein DnaC